MNFSAFAAVAAFVAVVSGPVIACEMHQSHAAMTTAAAEPAPPPKEAKPAPVVVLPMSKPAERPMQSMSSGYAGCDRNSESALLTN